MLPASQLQAWFKELRQWLEQGEPIFAAAAGLLVVRRMKFSHLVNSSHVNGLNFCSKTLTERPRPSPGSGEPGKKMSLHSFPVQCEVFEYL